MSEATDADDLPAEWRAPHKPGEGPRSRGLGPGSIVPVLFLTPPTALGVAYLFAGLTMAIVGGSSALPFQGVFFAFLICMTNVPLFAMVEASHEVPDGPCLRFGRAVVIVDWIAAALALVAAGVTAVL